MKGNQVFKMAVNTLDMIVDETLNANNLAKEDIDWVVPHQANIRILEATAKKLNMSMDKLIVTIDEQGNTSAASIPLALDFGIKKKKIKTGRSSRETRARPEKKEKKEVMKRRGKKKKNPDKHKKKIRIN